MHWLLLLIFLIQSSLVFGAPTRKGHFQSTKLGATQQNYTGNDRASFANGSPAYGVELSIDTGGNHLRYFFKARINNSIGSQNFTKGTTTFFSKYDYTAIEPELGLALYPVSRDEKGLNIYLWGVASISYNYLSINSVPANVAIESKGQEFGTGYGAGIGFEYILAALRTGKKIMVYSEVGFRDASAAMAGLEVFEVSGMTVSLGIGF
jgi:hypothetical protein